MISLNQSLATRDPALPLWSDRSGWRTAGTVLADARRWAGRLPRARVALAFQDDAALAVAILAAERHCPAVLLVPASWDQALVDRYLPAADISILVTDRTDLTAPTVLRVDGAGEDAVAADARPGETVWIIPTSGTTGAPKLVEHRFTTLARTVRTDASKGCALTWGLVYELARFAGLQVFLQAMLGGSRLVFAERRAGLPEIVAALAAAGCNALSATPTLWRRLLMAPQASRLPLVRATLGGEIADEAVLRQIATTFPAARVTHVYASTEAGVGFSVTDGRAGFPAAFLDGSAGGIELRVDASGMLWLRPAIAGQRFLGGTQALADDYGWINSGDRVRRDGDRYYFLGRANGAINVGGNKVYPEEVEDCIRRVSGVRHVGVRARANPLVGSLVEAVVQADPAVDRAHLKLDIVHTCRTFLAPYKVPAVVTWVDDVAVSAAGKLVRA